MLTFKSHCGKHPKNKDLHQDSEEGLTLAVFSLARERLLVSVLQLPYQSHYVAASAAAQMLDSVQVKKK